jgi:hypothetical protein
VLDADVRLRVSSLECSVFANRSGIRLLDPPRLDVFVHGELPGTSASPPHMGDFLRALGADPMSHMIAMGCQRRVNS